MTPERKTALIALGLILFFFLGVALFLNLPLLERGFLFGDQAIYFSMTASIARDFDLEYTKKDLVRYFSYFSAGPQGIFLKKGKDGKLFFAKSFVYSLFAAPFVRVFGPNGFLVFHAFLLGLILYFGFYYFSRANPPTLSLVVVLTFVFASVAGVYFLWISPDFFNFSLAFIIVFLWLAKNSPARPAAPLQPAGLFNRFLMSDGSDYLAAFIAGIAFFSKPPNLVLLGPLVLWALARKRWFKAAGIILSFALSAGILFGTNYALTGDWNYQGGERKSFYSVEGGFPFEKEGVTFDTAGHAMTSEGYLQKLYPLKFVFINIFYYFFGRFMGLTWYFFPAVLALILFVIGKKSTAQWLILLAVSAEILIYVILMPDNFGGGGGTLANRYFLNIYPLFLFLPPILKRRQEVVASWAMAAVFLGTILINPLQASAWPATHAKRLPFKLLPVEMTQINELPTNTNPSAFRVPVGSSEARGFLHFLDDNFNPKQADGVWTAGHGTAEIILKTYFPVKEIVFHLSNCPRKNNVITVTVEGRTQRLILQEKEAGTLRFPVGEGFVIKQAHLYKIKIGSSKYAIPYFESESNREHRNLGVFFSLELVPGS
ncbi:MAG: hypothetical protein MUP19_03555 [Candidatus Aminicenantes bacterium]|nr:hypothetical protein [Candidatus Aminicenantes bacterium]